MAERDVMENIQQIEGRNAVLEAFRSGQTIDKVYLLDGCQDGPIRTILREAKKCDTLIQFVTKQRLDQLSETKNPLPAVESPARYMGGEANSVVKDHSQMLARMAFVFPDTYEIGRSEERRVGKEC